jgi:hypothetical protein
MQLILIQILCISSLSLFYSCKILSMIKIISDKLNTTLKKSFAPLPIPGIKKTESIVLPEKK